MAVAGAAVGLVELVELIADASAITAEMSANLAATEAAVSSLAVAETSFVGTETAAVTASTAAVLEVSGGTVETAGVVAESMAATAEASESITLAATSSSILGETTITETGLAETSFTAGSELGLPIATSTPFAVGGGQAITPGVILPFTLDVTGEITGGGAVAGTTSFLAANATVLAESTSFLAAGAGASVGAALLSTSTIAAGTGAAASAALSTSATASSSTAVVSGIVASWIGKGVLTAISAAGLGQGVYKAIQKLEQYLPGSSDALLKNIESGEINQKNILTWLQLLDNKFNILSSLRNSGTYVISDEYGNLVKVGSAIFKVLQSNKYRLDKTTVLEALKQSNMSKNLNTDIITNMWQAMTTY